MNSNPSTFSERTCDTIARQLFYDTMAGLLAEFASQAPSPKKIEALAKVANAAGFGFVDAGENDNDSPLRQPAVNDALMDERARAVYVRALSACRNMIEGVGGSVAGFAVMDLDLLHAFGCAADAAASGFADGEDAE
jgi:hypothetical protein